MRRASIIVLLLAAVYLEGRAQSLTVFRSPRGVVETAEKVGSTIDSRRLRTLEQQRLFNLVDRDGKALDSLVVISFEDPALATALLACEPTAALDLPQKVMVWRENGDVYLGFMDPYFMKKRFMIRDCEETIDQMTRLLLRIVNEAIKSTP